MLWNAWNLVGFLLVGDNLFDTNSSLNGDGDCVLASIPGITNLIGKGLREAGQVEVGLLVASFVHQGELSAILNIDNLPVGTVDNGDGGTVGGGNHIFVLLSSEDIGGDKVTLGVTVLSSLGDGDGEDLARLSLDHHVSVGCRNVETQGNRVSARCQHHYTFETKQFRLASSSMNAA